MLDVLSSLLIFYFSYATQRAWLNYEGSHSFLFPRMSFQGTRADHSWPALDNLY